MTSKATTSLQADGFHCTGYNAARAFSSFLPGIAGPCGKPMWVFYANRGQCITSFGVRDRNSAMLEFHPANKAYVLTPLLGFRSFVRVRAPAGATLHEPFQAAGSGSVQTLVVRAHEVEIVEEHAALGLRMRVVYFTLPNEDLPALVRQVTLDNIGDQPLHADVLDGLPQIVPYGLEEKLLKQMSRTMEAFAEIRHVDASLPFFKLKVEPSDKPDAAWIEGGFFTFTLHEGRVAPVVCDPDLVFGSDTSLRTPLAFQQDPAIDPARGRRETMTGCAFAQLPVLLAPGASTTWVSCFGQAAHWSQAQALRGRMVADAGHVAGRRRENRELIGAVGERMAVIAGPSQLGPYTAQAFLDNTLRGGQPVVVQGPLGPRVFHTFTRKHGDMERDYNVFELAPTYWSQGNANFRDVNQNRRSENFSYPDIDTANIETFFNLLQIDGNNPLVVQPERFMLPAAHAARLSQDWPAGATEGWRAFLAQPFSPGQLMERLVVEHATPAKAQPWFERILGLCDKVEGATHGEGYWVDHWIYNLDLLESYAALYPDRMRRVLVQRPEFSYFDNPHTVQPRHAKYQRRADGAVRQLHAVALDAEKAALIAQRTESPNLLRGAHGRGEVFRTTLLAKIFGQLAIKSTLIAPSGLGLEMESEKPGWCDALNGLPGLFGSSTHEAHALRRWLRFAAAAVAQHVSEPHGLSLAVEVADLLQAVTSSLQQADCDHFHATWEQLAEQREIFRSAVRFGVCGQERMLDAAELLAFCAALDPVLGATLARAVDGTGLPMSYYVHEARSVSPAPELPVSDTEAAPVQRVTVHAFDARPVAAFLEGAVHAMRGAESVEHAAGIRQAVRASALYDAKLGMYRVNAPLDGESFEIGRSRIFAPGWLENESVFLHMHYKFLLETLRSGQSEAFFDDLRRGLVAFHDPAVYGRSTLENSSFIASSRFPDAATHGAGFVARLSGATAEWISMLLHMALGARPFVMVDGALRFAPRPVLADWLFTDAPCGGFDADSFGLTLFGRTWLVYHNPARRASFGPDAVAPRAFALRYADGRSCRHEGAWLPSALALDLRGGALASLVVELG